MAKKGLNFMNIKEAEKVTGLTKANIRFYEEEGLVKPERNEQNNYRIYKETEIKKLLEIKKLRMLGVSISEIRMIYSEELSLEEAMERRLKEIQKEEKLLKETSSICQKAIKNHWKLEEIEQLEIAESKEEWQERLRALMTEDIVKTILTRNELNNTIAVPFIAGTIISMVVVRLLNITLVEKYYYVGMAAILAEFVLYFISSSSRNIKTHMSVLAIGTIIQPIGLATIVGLLLGAQAECRNAAHHFIFALYFAMLIIGSLLWIGSKMCKSVLNSFGITLLASVVCVAGVNAAVYFKYSAVLASGDMAVLVVISVFYVLTVFGAWQHANSDQKSYNRYHAVYTASTMINVIATIVSKFGYYSSRNWRR